MRLFVWDLWCIGVGKERFMKHIHIKRTIKKKLSTSSSCDVYVPQSLDNVININILIVHAYNENILRVYIYFEDIVVPKKNRTLPLSDLLRKKILFFFHLKKSV